MPSRRSISWARLLVKQFSKESVAVSVGIVLVLVLGVDACSYIFVVVAVMVAVSLFATWCLQLVLNFCAVA